MTLQHEKEVVSVIMPVPDELALRLDDHDVMPIELCDGSGLPVFRKGGQLYFEIHWIHLAFSLLRYMNCCPTLSFTCCRKPQRRRSEGWRQSGASPGWARETLIVQSGNAISPRARNSSGNKPA